MARSEDKEYPLQREREIRVIKLRQIIANEEKSLAMFETLGAFGIRSEARAQPIL